MIDICLINWANYYILTPDKFVKLIGINLYIYLLGGALGSAASYMMTSNFKSIPQILREDMTEEQRKKLFRRVSTFFRGIMITDVASAMAILSTNVNLKSNIVSVLIDYLRNDMGLNIWMTLIIFLFFIYLFNCVINVTLF